MKGGGIGVAPNRCSNQHCPTRAKQGLVIKKPPIPCPYCFHTDRGLLKGGGKGIPPNRCSNPRCCSHEMRREGKATLFPDEPLSKRKSEKEEQQPRPKRKRGRPRKVRGSSSKAAQPAGAARAPDLGGSISSKSSSSSDSSSSSSGDGRVLSLISDDEEDKAARYDFNDLSDDMTLQCLADSLVWGGAAAAPDID